MGMGTRTGTEMGTEMGMEMGIGTGTGTGMGTGTVGDSDKQTTTDGRTDRFSKAIIVSDVPYNTLRQKWGRNLANCLCLQVPHYF